MKAKFCIVFLILLFNVNAYSQIEGEYKSVGYYNHPTLPRVISISKILTKVSDSIYTTTLGDLSGGVLKLNIHKNNTVTFENSVTTTGEGTIIPTADSTNSFDAVNKKFNLHYQFTLSTGTRHIREQMTRLLQFKQNDIEYVQTSPMEVKVLKGDSCKGAITIPSKVTFGTLEFNVTKIDNKAFLSNKNITDVMLPTSIKFIGERAFGWCGNLKSINIPDSVAFIGDNAFSTTSISSIFIPKNAIDIGFHLFYQCRNLSAINVSVENPNCKSVDGVLFSKTGYYLFEYPNGKQDKAYTIPEGTVRVYDRAFDGGNSYLQDLIMPEGLINCGYWAFMNLHKLKSIKISSTLKTLNGALNSSPELERIEVSELNPYFRSVNGLLFNAKLDSLIKCPAKLANISSYLIPNTVKHIESMAFKNCEGLITISIPQTVIYIGWTAFSYCTNLKNVYSYAPTPISLSVTGLSDVGKNNATLYVPSGSKGLYEVANEWKDFATIVEMTTGVNDNIYNDLTIKHIPVENRIIVSNLIGEATLTIYDINGITILINQLNGNVNLSTDFLQKGIYVVNIKSGSKNSSIKIVKL